MSICTIKESRKKRVPIDFNTHKKCWILFLHTYVHTAGVFWQSYTDDRYMIFYKTVCCLNANGSFDPQETDTNRFSHESSFLPRQQYIYVETDKYVYQIVLWVLTHFHPFPSGPAALEGILLRRVVKTGFCHKGFGEAPLQRVATFYLLAIIECRLCLSALDLRQQEGVCFGI